MDYAHRPSIEIYEMYEKPRYIMTEMKRVSPYDDVFAVIIYSVKKEMHNCYVLSIKDIENWTYDIKDIIKHYRPVAYETCHDLFRYSGIFLDNYGF